MVDHGIMSQNEPISLQKREELIQKPVGLMFYKTFQVVHIIKVKNARATADTKCMANHITSHVPECQDTVESAFRYIEAGKNVGKGKKVLFIEPYSS